MTINLFVQEDRSPSGTGRAQFQTHTNEQRASDRNVQATTNNTVDPRTTHPHWQLWRGGYGLAAFFAACQLVSRVPKCAGL